MIRELMGVPEADRHRLYELSHALIDDQDPEVAPTPETSMEASVETFGYANEMAARERAHPSGTLTSTLLEAEVDGRELTDIELVAPPRRLHSNLINGIKEMQIRYSVR